MQQFKRIFARMAWPSFWLILGALLVIGLQFNVHHKTTQQLRVEGKKSTALSEKWLTALARPTQELAADARILSALRTPIEGEDATYKNQTYTRILNEFSYLYGVENIYLMEGRNVDHIFFPYTSLNPGERLINLWQSMLQESAGFGHSVRLAQIPNMRNILEPVLIVMQPVLAEDNSTVIGGVSTLFTMPKAATQHTRFTPKWHPLAQGYIYDTAASPSPMVMGPLWQGVKHPRTAVIGANLPPNVQRKLTRKNGELATHVAPVRATKQGGGSAPAAQLFQTLPLTVPNLQVLILVPNSGVGVQVRPWQFLVAGLAILFAVLSVIVPIVRRYQQKMAKLHEAKLVERRKNREDYNYQRLRSRSQFREKPKLGAKRKPLIQKIKSPDKKLMERILDSLEKKRTTLLFQPIFSTQNPTTPVMYEVLLRIHDALGNPITPAEFVPIAQKFNLFAQIDIHVVMRVIDEYLAPNQATQVPLAVNLGIETFQSETFLQAFIQRIQPEWSQKLIFEVRSTDIIKDKHATKFMKQAREQGCQFSSDYFGGGESMLNGANRLKFNYIKLDAQKFQTSEQKKELIRLVQKAQSLGLQIVLERVEEKADGLLAEKLGIPFIQGYYYGKPKEQM